MTEQNNEREPRVIEFTRYGGGLVSISADCIASVDTVASNVGGPTCYVQPKWLGEDGCYRVIGNYKDIKRLVFGDQVEEAHS